MLSTQGWCAYAAAHFCKSLIWHASTLLFGFFLTETCDLRPAEMGMVLGVSLLGQAVADVVIGARLRHRVTGARAAARAQACWAPATAMFFVLFATTVLVAPPLRVAFAGGSLIAFRLTFALVDVPQNGMIPFLADDPARQARLLALRNILAGVANLIVALAATSVVLAPWLKASAGYVGGSVILSVLLIASSFRLAAVPLPAANGATRSTATSADGLPGLPLLLAVAAGLVFASTAFRAMEAYAAAFAKGGIGIMIWAAIGSILCQPMWVAVDRWSGRRYAPLLAGACAATGALVLLGPGRASHAGAALAGLGFGIGSGGLWLMIWAFAVRHAAVGGETWTIGLLTGTSKLAQSAAMVGVGSVLAHSPYRTTLADPLSAPSLAMIATLLLTASCGVALTLAQPGVSRTSRGAGPGTRRPAGPRVRDRRPQPPILSAAHVDPVAPAG